MEPESLIFNGINGASGDYLLPPFTTHDISKIAQGEKLEPAHLQELIQRWAQKTQPHFGVREITRGDATQLSRSSWGVISPLARTRQSARRSRRCSIGERRRRVRRRKSITRNSAASAPTGPANRSSNSWRDSARGRGLPTPTRFRITS